MNSSGAISVFNRPILAGVVVDLVKWRRHKSRQAWLIMMTADCNTHLFYLPLTIVVVAEEIYVLPLKNNNNNNGRSQFNS